MNIKELNSYICQLEKELEIWSNSKDFDDKWGIYIIELPQTIKLLSIIYLNPKSNSDIKNKIKSTIEYIKSPLDYLPEGLMGCYGYIDDLFISCLCFDYCYKHLNIENENNIDIHHIKVKKIILDSKTMLGDIIHNKVLNYFQSI